MLKIKDNIDKTRWDDFIAKSPHRSIYVFSKFLDSLGVDYNLVACCEGEKIVAGVPIIYSGGSPIISPFNFTQYQGIILGQSTKNQPHSVISSEFKAVEFLLESLAQKHSQYCFSQSWRFADLRPFQWHNYHEPDKGQFKLDLRYTGILNLLNYSSFEEYYSSIRGVRRQEFKKSQAVLTIVDSEDVELLNRLHEKTFNRQGLARSEQESSLVRTIALAALRGNYGKLRVALFNNQPIAAVLFLFDDRTAYYSFGATDPAFRQYNAGTSLLLNLIEEAFGRCAEVDFVGVNSPNRGDFKLSFNAEVRPYFLAILK